MPEPINTNPNDETVELPDRGLNPFNYSIPELSKTLVALVGFVGFAALTFITFDPSLIQSIELLIPAAASVYLVFASTKKSPADAAKALNHLLAATVTTVTYFHTVPADTTNKIGMAIGAFAVLLGVYWKRNQSA